MPHALLFVRPFDADTWTVDRMTGSHGFGHVAIWAGTVERNQPIVLDANTITKDVDFRPLSAMTRGAKYHRHDLDDAMGAWIFARALRCIGKPYDFGGLFRGRRSDAAFTCSGLVCCALPLQLEQRCRAIAAQQRRPVSPNAIAIACGVPRWTP